MPTITSYSARGFNKTREQLVIGALDMVARVLPLIPQACGSSAVAYNITGGLVDEARLMMRAANAERAEQLDLIDALIEAVDCIHRAPSDLVPHPIDTAANEARNAKRYLLD